MSVIIRPLQFAAIDSYEGELDEPNTLHRYAYATNDPVNSTDPSGDMSIGDSSAASSNSSIVNSIATPSFQTMARKFLIGDPKKGEFGLIGDLILDACMGAVDSVITNSKGKKSSKQNKGTFAHTLLEQEIRFLNDWLAKGSLTHNISLAAEVSKDSGKKDAKYGARGSYRLDVVVFYRGRTAVAFDLKTGKNVQTGIGAKGWTVAKRLEYQRRFRTRVFTIGVEIP